MLYTFNVFILFNIEKKRKIETAYSVHNWLLAPQFRFVVFVKLRVIESMSLYLKMVCMGKKYLGILKGTKLNHHF
ncbi:MAG: hypothetical protein CMH17_01070 [Methylophaga sp.]|nr:hypothetical protein [Methylophaga sp.]|tara:strand:- start:257 stop:481 length:225 start_codon:yes stop_codon:yes gene_type:complete